MARKLKTPEGRRALAAVGLTSFRSLIAQYTAGPEEITAFVGNGPLLTDDRPRIEFFRSLDAGAEPTDSPGLRGDVRDILGG